MGLPRRIVVATIPRSGSTWVFNALRLILSGAGETPQAVWVDDFDPRHPAATALIKTHGTDLTALAPDLVVTTARPVSDCLASLVRMGWLAEDATTVQAKAQELRTAADALAAQADVVVPYAKIMNAPGDAVASLAQALGLTCDAQGIVAAIAALDPPASGAFDPTTLLHPGHRGGTQPISAATQAALRALPGSDG